MFGAATALFATDGFGEVGVQCVVNRFSLLVLALSGALGLAIAAAVPKAVQIGHGCMQYECLYICIYIYIYTDMYYTSSYMHIYTNI